MGFLLTFALFHATATWWGSTRGEAGAAVAGVVLISLLLVQRGLLRESWASALAPLGRPSPRGLVTAAGVSAALLAVVPAYGLLRGMEPRIHEGSLALLPGLFCQAGVAEEALFRGYAYHLLRRGRSFWHAAWRACVPFAAVHLFLFAVLPWPIALASLALALLVSFPLAHVFELCGRRIWGPALLHGVIQAVPKLLSFDADSSFPLMWMAAAGIVPYAVFFVARTPATGEA
ncbi:MAG: CPBP family glutamic-type intramembrane protease [Planctomycetota bacterium]